MSRPLQIGDYALISLEGTERPYKITSIGDRITATRSGQTLTLFFDGNRWRIEGVDPFPEIKFIAGEVFPLDLLPDITINKIGIKVGLKDLFNLCLANKRLNSLLCSNEFFWKEKYHYDFGEPRSDPVTTWKEKYKIKSFNKVFAFGFIPLEEMPPWEGRPVQITDIKAKDIAAGLSHSIILALDGSVYVFGSGDQGELGLGYGGDPRTEVRIPAPTQIPGFKAKAVFAGSSSSFLIDLQDNLWAFGSNLRGELGLPEIEGGVYKVPTQVPGIKAKYLSAGVKGTVVIDLDNNVWLFGHVNSVWKNRENWFTPIKIPDLKAKDVAVGLSHVALIDLENNVWVFGRNHLRQLGLDDKRDRETPTKLSGIKARSISAGPNHTVVLDLENNVIGFGSNAYGQLGPEGEGDFILNKGIGPITKIKARSIAAGGDATFFVDLDRGRIWGLGRTGLHESKIFGIPVPILNFEASCISTGVEHTLFIGRHVEEPPSEDWVRRLLSVISS